METFISIVLILAILIGLPVLLLWLKDRSGRFRGVAEWIIVVLGLLLDLAILTWVIYAIMFLPQRLPKDFNYFQLIILVLLIAWRIWERFFKRTSK